MKEGKNRSLLWTWIQGFPNSNKEWEEKIGNFTVGEGGFFTKGIFLPGEGNLRRSDFDNSNLLPKLKTAFCEYWSSIMLLAATNLKIVICEEAGGRGGGIKIWWGEQMFGWWVGDSLHSPSPVGKSLDSAMRRWYKIIVRYLSSSSSYFWTLCTSIYFKLLYAEAFLITNCSLVTRKHVWVRNC